MNTETTPLPWGVRSLNGTLHQVRPFAGDTGGRWKVRVLFDGHISGEDVKAGDVLSIGRAIFDRLDASRFELLEAPPGSAP